MTFILRIFAYLTGQKIVYLLDFDGEVSISLAFKTPFGWVAKRNGRKILLEANGKTRGVPYVVAWKE